MLQRGSPANNLTERQTTERQQQSSGGFSQHRPQARLKRRPDFLAAAKGRRFHSNCFSLQALCRPAAAGEDGADPRFGFTVTKKIGGAVVRNRIRRRLKEALRLAADLPVRPGYDYVIVARAGVLNENFCDLQNELRRAIAAIHQPGRAGQGKGRDGRTGRRNRPAQAQPDRTAEEADE